MLGSPSGTNLDPLGPTAYAARWPWVKRVVAFDGGICGPSGALNSAMAITSVRASASVLTKVDIVCVWCACVCVRLSVCVCACVSVCL